MVRQIQMQKSNMPFDGFEIREWQTYDGTRLTYYVMGKRSAPPMVIANGLGGNMLAWRHFIRYFARHFRVYIWDYRGLFQSDAPKDCNSYSIPHHSQDLESLLDHEGIQSPLLVGWSMGVQVILEFFRTYPNRARAFVALNGTHGYPLRTAFYSNVREKRFEQVFKFVQKHWHRAVWIRPHVTRTSIMETFVRAIQAARIAGASLDRESFFDMASDFMHNDLKIYSEIFQQLGRHSAKDVLPNIQTPALIVAGSRDSFIPAYLSKEISQNIPHSEYWEIPGATHFCPLEYPHTINHRIKQYLIKIGAMSEEVKALVKVA